MSSGGAAAGAVAAYMATRDSNQTAADVTQIIPLMSVMELLAMGSLLVIFLIIVHLLGQKKRRNFERGLDITKMRKFNEN